MINKVIGNYKILQEIGEGGMGTVYLGEHIILGTKSAVKVLFPHLAKSQAIADRFVREAKAQAALKHPNIIRAIDYLESDDYRALVMEFIEGKPLSEIIEEKQSSLSYKEILEIIEGPLRALDYAHSQGIIHRDVKPSNIIVDNNNKGYLGDFGIAMILGMERKTLTGANLGTPHYMSPEQALNPKTVDHRTDIYSIGCVLYEMTTGIPPFDGDTDFQIIEKHIKNVPKSIEEIKPHIPKYFASAVFKALEKNPNDRFSGCQDFLSALNNNNMTQKDFPSSLNAGLRRRNLPEIDRKVKYEGHTTSSVKSTNLGNEPDSELKVLFPHLAQNQAMSESTEIRNKRDKQVEVDSSRLTDSKTPRQVNLDGLKYEDTSGSALFMRRKEKPTKKKTNYSEKKETDWELIGKIVLAILALGAAIALGYGIYLLVAAIIEFISENWLIIIIVIIVLIWLFNR